MDDVPTAMPVSRLRQAISGLRSIRFDRNEIAGAFGDIGTSLPLIAGMLLVSDMDVASVLIVFGGMQIFSGLVYRMPLPVQPLKAVAAIVIAERLSGSVVYGAGLTIGCVMLLMSVTGIVGWLARLIPKCVIRGIQFGLGMKLCIIALGASFVGSHGAVGYFLAAVSAVIVVLLLGSRKYPPAIIVVLLGVLYALFVHPGVAGLRPVVGFALPQLQVPTAKDAIAGFLTLALAQIPLSLGNSIFATARLSQDLFPERRVTVRKIGLTYSLMNIAAPFFSGIPVCHGSGGMAGHHTFGGRTGGSVIVYGSLLAMLGLFFSGGFAEVIRIFPSPVLGIILMFEGLALMRFIRDVAGTRSELGITLLVGVLAIGVPSYGFLVGMVAGTVLAHASKRFPIGFTKDKDGQ